MMKIELPFLAEGVEEGDVVAVLVKEGDQVKENDTLIELETDKATVPVPSPSGGKVGKILVNAGDRVKVGQAIVEIEESASAEKAEAQPEEKAPEQQPTKEKAKEEKPATAEAPPEKSAEAAKTATQKASTEQAEKSETKVVSEPKPTETQESAAEEAPTAAAPKPQAPPAKEATKEPTGAGAGGPDTPAPPSVRRLARELGVDLRLVKGSEAGGRITQEDVKAFVRERSRSLGEVGEKPAPVFTTLYGNERREPLPSIRRKIAANMAQAWSTIPHVHQLGEADITDLISLQKRYNPKFKERGASLTVTSLIIKAVVHALKMYPQFNATIDLTNGEVVYKEYYNMGVAVDTEAGLIVPVIHQVDKKDLFQIAHELADLAERTRQRQIKLEELRGATFTISNLGGIGGGAFMPIINAPEVAILGVGRGKQAPVYTNGTWEPRMMLPICVGYDHRLIDGADGARFTNEIIKVLEDYEAMFLGL